MRRAPRPAPVEAVLTPIHPLAIVRADHREVATEVTWRGEGWGCQKGLEATKDTRGDPEQPASCPEVAASVGAHRNSCRFQRITVSGLMIATASSTLGHRR